MSQIYTTIPTKKGQVNNSLSTCRLKSTIARSYKYTMTENLDITKVRVSIAELAYDIEEMIRINPELLLADDALKKEIIKALIDQMTEVDDLINLHSEDQSLDQCLLFLVVRILELRKKIKETKSPNLCQDSWII